MTRVQDVAVVHLHIGHFKVGNTINDDVSSIILLPSRFCIETSLVQDDTKRRALGNFSSRLGETLVVKDGLDCSIDVAKI